MNAQPATLAYATTGVITAAVVVTLAGHTLPGLNTTSAALLGGLIAITTATALRTAHHTNT